MKYIDTENLKAKIEGVSLIPQTSADYNDGRDDMKMMILDIIDSLQQEQPEVDLEKEISRVSKNEYFDFTDWKSIARHFFEVGMKQAKVDDALVEDIYSHIDGIKDTADRMTSGNFMHHRAAIKFSANVIKNILGLMVLKTQKGE